MRASYILLLVQYRGRYIQGSEIDGALIEIQGVPALRVFWDLEKTVLHETRVSDFRVSGGPPVYSMIIPSVK